MSIYDVCVLLACVLVGLAVAVGAGCATRDTSDVGYLPYMEMDYTPARTVPVRSVVARRAEPAKTLPKAPQASWAPQGNRPWRHIVIHHSATTSGNAAEFNAKHVQRGWDELGYHFVIDNGDGGPDGLVEVGPRWQKQKWGAHTGGTPNNEYNNFGIGVCLVGNFTHHNPSRSQLGSLRKLIGYLMRRYDIPAGQIIAHRDAPNAHTECCGKTFINYLDNTFKPSLAGTQ